MSRLRYNFPFFFFVFSQIMSNFAELIIKTIYITQILKVTDL